MLASRFTRAASALLIVIAAVLAAFVILGMATGTHREFAKGEAPLQGVILVQVVGAISLITLGAVVWFCAEVRKGHRRPLVRSTSTAVAIWLFWALLRIGEYAS